MVLYQQVWSTELERYLEDELSLCDCLPSTVREGLVLRQPSLFGPEWDDLAESA